MAVNIPLGFRFAGVHAGIKKNASKEDLTLVHCPEGAVAAGVYTTNLCMRRQWWWIGRGRRRVIFAW